MFKVLTADGKLVALENSFKKIQKQDDSNHLTTAEVYQGRFISCTWWRKWPGSEEYEIVFALPA